MTTARAVRALVIVLCAAFARASANATQAAANAPQDTTTSWTARARSVADLAGAERIDAELAPDRGVAAVRAEPDLRAAWLGRTYALLQDRRAARASAEELERAAIVARHAAAWFGNPGNELRVLVELASAHLENGRRDAARDVIESSRTLCAMSPRVAPWITHLNIVLARQAGDLDAVTELCARARTQIEDCLANDATAPEAEAHWTGSHGELAALVESELGGARLEAGLPELAAAAYDAGRRRAEAIAPQWDSDRVSALVRCARDELNLALGTERLASARRICDETLAGTLALQPEERFVFELGRALADVDESRGAPQATTATRARLVQLERTAKDAGPGIDAATRASIELALAELELREKDWTAARARLAACAGFARAAHAIEFEPGLTRLEGRAAALAVRVAIDSGAPRDELAHARDGLRAVLDQTLESWERRPLRPGGLGFFYWGTQRLVVSELLCAEIALDPGPAGVTAALEHLVRAQRVGTLSRALLDGWRPGWDDVRKELAGVDGGWMIFFPAMERSHLFLVEDARVEHVELPSRDVVVAASQALRDLLQRPPEPSVAGRVRAIEQRADALGELVLRGPARERLRAWSRVRVVGAELFQGLPVECLRLDGAWLGCVRAVSHVPSLPAAAALARRTRSTPAARREHDFVLLAAPEVARATLKRWPAQRSIPLEPEDEDSITAAFDARATLVLRGSEASTDALQRADVQGTAVLGLLTHGVQDFEQERTARLLLAPGANDAGELSCERVDALPRTPPLVLLAACSSASGPQRLGDDTGSHLAASFLRRGTNAVVMNRGDVSYLATVAISAGFTRALAEGVAPDEALRRARAELADSTEFADPFYFGLVSITGLADRSTFTLAPVRRTSTTTAITLAAAASIAVVASAFIWRASRARRAQIGEYHQAE